MNSDIQKKLENEWKHKVRLTVEGGTFVVTNPTGTWDGDKFKKYDGTYVMNDFVVSKGKTYYFDADGNKVTGKQTINNATISSIKTVLCRPDGRKLMTEHII